DPFAGMKACVNYQQEIERLKQLVKTPPSPPPPITTASEAPTPDDTTTTAGPVVTEQEKIRFLAFVCSWTTGGPTSQFLETTNSLWAIPSPW
ncbi:uncharacterized protein EV154DRAFT_402866, partial [Mucor mucedo]|uniref:uncharacterized protein n=1 Tax=Mucor mucedo TaxID=29922 RepID=UPI00221F3A45